MTTAVPRVTVAICTRNRAALLNNTLRSLEAMRVPSTVIWRLIVVDNGSTDETQTVCASFAGRLPIESVVEAKSGLSNARNRALQLATGDYLVFTDDDVIVEADWLTAFVDATLAWPEAQVLGGPIIPNFPREPDPDLVAAFPKLADGFCGLDYGRPAGPLPDSMPVWGANMAYRRNAIEGLTFDPALGRTPTSQIGGEEEAFQIALRARGAVVVWCPRMRLKHYVDPSRMTLDYLVAFYMGQGEQFIRFNGVPTPSTPTLFGAPRWFLRQTIEAYGRYLVARLTSTRREALKKLRVYSEYRGMLAACRATRQQPI